MNGFGPHLMMDGYGCDKKKLQDLNLIYRLLDELPTRIGMTKIMPPYVFKYSGLRPEDWGLSGFVLIAESHISVHTFPERNLVYLDVFSCMPFDADMVLKRLTEHFSLYRAVPHRIERGLEFFNEQFAREAAARPRVARPA